MDQEENMNLLESKKGKYIKEKRGTEPNLSKRASERRTKGGCYMEEFQPGLKIQTRNLSPGLYWKL